MMVESTHAREEMLTVTACICAAMPAPNLLPLIIKEDNSWVVLVESFERLWHIYLLCWLTK